MKIAIMLTGLARKVEQGYNQYWKHIIDNYDCDLYLHSWESKIDGITNHEDSEIVKQIYKNPKYLKFEKPFKFTEYRKGIVIPNGDKSRPLVDYDVFSNFRSFPMYYGWQSTYTHIKQSGIKYDYIIRSRYDISGLPLYLEYIDNSLINTSAMHWPGDKIHDDNLCILNQQNANIIFSDVFDRIVETSKKLGYLDFAEKTFTEHVYRCGLESKLYKNENIRFNLLRDGKNWGFDDINIA